MLSVQAVSKRYGAHPALDGVSLEVAAGEILGLLGPNGAGKTTLISIVAGLRRPDSGRVEVGGIDVARAPQQARRLIGLAPQDTGVYPTLTVRDNLRFFAGLAGLRARALRNGIDAVAGALMLDALMDRRASELSGGERRRLHTAIALVHRPQLVLLDEPTTGADVQTRNEILRLVRSLADDGSAVVYSTHYLHEIEELGAHVAFIDPGRIVARGELDELIRRYAPSALELTFADAVPAAARRGRGRHRHVSADHNRRSGRHRGEVAPSTRQGTSELRAIELVRPSLESVFITVTGRRYDHAAEPAA